MSRRTATVLAWGLVGVSAVLGFVGIGFKVAIEGAFSWHFVANDLIPIAIFFASAVVGALVASRLPQNPIGWIFLGLTVALGLSGAGDGYATQTLDHGSRTWLTPWAGWYASNSFVSLFAAVVFVLLLFPDGHLLTRRWKVVLWVGIAALVGFSLGAALQPGELGSYPGLRNPAGVGGALTAVLGVPSSLLLLGTAVAAAVSMVLRFRRARGIERQQLTLLAFAATLATTMICLGWVVGSAFSSDDLGVATIMLGVLAIPVAVGVAMLRYRLYDVGRLVSRTLVYTGLTLVLGSAYVGLVLLAQAGFSSFAGGSDLAIAGSTLVVAALFLPVRARIQRLVDRRFYRRRYDAQRTLEDFGSRLREQIELETLRRDLLAVVSETMQPTAASVWLREVRP